MIIKNWSKSMELPYRIDYQNTLEGYNKSLKLGKKGIIILRDSKKGFGEKGFLDSWTVNHRQYVFEKGQSYVTLGHFKTKKEAIEFAIRYMKNHPEG